GLPVAGTVGRRRRPVRADSLRRRRSNVIFGLKSASPLGFPSARPKKRLLIPAWVSGSVPALRTMRRFLLRKIFAAVLCSILIGQALPAEERVDLQMVTKIRLEGFRDSKVMETASRLMDSIGPRLTGSPNMKKANEWTRKQL